VVSSNSIKTFYLQKQIVVVTFVITDDKTMKTVLIPDQKEANEKFFRMMIGTIKENGVYGYSDGNAVFTKKMGKFYGNQSDIDAIRHLVSDDFFYIYFQNIDELETIEL
jgi:hypothetical protein